MQRLWLKWMCVRRSALVQGLTYHTSLIPPENHVLRYSILILSCVPSATNQIVLTTIVAPPDQATNADLFGEASSAVPVIHERRADAVNAPGCFLLAQYAVLFVAFTVVAGFSLSLSELELRGQLRRSSSTAADIDTIPRSFLKSAL